MTKFNELPMNVQQEVKSVLMVYGECHVWYEFGKYQATANVCLRNSYGADHRYIGIYKKEEVFTAEEIIENYINVFYEFPISYKGKRDYRLLNEKKTDREFTDDGVYEWKGKLDENGDFVWTHREFYKI